MLVGNEPLSNEEIRKESLMSGPEFDHEVRKSRAWELKAFRV
jgi:hypothetical protein